MILASSGLPVDAVTIGCDTIAKRMDSCTSKQAEALIAQRVCFSIISIYATFQLDV